MLQRRDPVKQSPVVNAYVALRFVMSSKVSALGAHRAGITTVILPKENEADMEDIPEDVRRSLTFHCVSTLDEVFDIALVPQEQCETKTRKTVMEEAEEHAGV